MELKIYDTQGIVRLVCSPDSSSQWRHEIGVENVVSVNFTTWEYHVIHVGWYIIIADSIFKIKALSKPKHINDSKYTYNLKFYGKEHDTEDLLFCRQNQSIDDLESVFAYDATPAGFLAKVVENMNRNSEGFVWKAGDAVVDKRKTINFNGLYVWDALGEIARAFDTEWWVEGEYIHLTKCVRGESYNLGYGLGLKTGLQQNENTNAINWFTRLIPVGSTKNIDKRKYGYETLQLPGREKYIDVNTELGLKEHREVDAFSGIYPHRVGKITDVRTDIRTSEETGDFTIYYVSDDFLPFDPNEYMLPDEVIHMTFNTGNLAGKEFEVNWKQDSREFEIINQYPDDDTQLPGGNLIPDVNDEYVLTNISMPDEYITIAEDEYQNAVNMFISDFSKDVSVYTGNTDYIYIRNNNIPLLVGQRINLVSKHFENGRHESRITSVTRKLNNLDDATINCCSAINQSWKSNVDSSINSIKYTLSHDLATKGDVDKFDYLTAALKEDTSIEGGLIQSALLKLGYTDTDGIFKVMSGTNGIYSKESIGGGVASWWGGGLHDLLDYFYWSEEGWKALEGAVVPSNIPSGLIRHDGTGYFANGNFWWDKNGRIHADPTALLLSFDVETGDETLASTIINIRKDTALFSSMFSKKKDKNGIEYLYTSLPIVTQFGLTMYGDPSTLEIPSIYDGLPIDGNTIYWENGILKAKGGGGTGGVDEDAVRTLIESYDYATKDFVRDYVLQNATGGEFELSKQMVIDALGFTPYSAENPNGYITAASIPSALKNPYALTFGSKTYDGSAAKSITASDLGAALSSDLSDYLPLSGGTISSSNQAPLSINSTSDNTRSFIIFKHNGVNKAYIGYTTANGAFIENPTSGNRLSILDNLLYNDKTVWHSGNFNPANYLPLSGGTIQVDNVGKFNVYNTAQDGSYVHFFATINSAKTDLGYIGINKDKVPTFMTSGGVANKIWHAGNDGSESGLDADLLDGKHLSQIFANRIAVADISEVGDIGLYHVKDTATNFKVANGYLLNFKYGNIALQLNANYAGKIYARSVWYSTAYDWNQLAYVTDNVASATKLQTARTIWGQSFDGTADVTGSLKIPNDYTLRWVNNAGTDINCMYLSNENKFFIGNGVAEKGYDTYLSGKNLIFRYGTSRTVGAILNSSGNLTIGATDLAGTASKLYVNGTALIGNNVDGGELLRFNMDRYWSFIQEESGASSKLVLKAAFGDKYFIIRNSNNEKILLCHGKDGSNTVEIGGSLRMDNNKNVQAKDTSGNNISLFGFNSSNQLSIGYGLNPKGYIMELGGKIVNFYYGTERTLGMVLNESGNVGIGTTSPLSKCHIVHSDWDKGLVLQRAISGAGSGIKFMDSVSMLGIIGINGNKVLEVDLSKDDSTTVNRLTIDNTGTMSVNSDNAGVIVLKRLITNGGAFVDYHSNNSSSRNWRVGSNSSGSFSFYSYVSSTETERVTIVKSGNMGLGKSNPSAKLHVVGNILATGGITMQSQRSLKNVVDERGLSLTELSAIKPTRFTWKDKRDDKLHFGGIADDIERVLPEVIYTTSDGTLTMDYGNAGFAIAASLIKPVIDHETEICLLKIRVKELEEELKRYSA